MKGCMRFMKEKRSCLVRDQDWGGLKWKIEILVIFRTAHLTRNTNNMVRVLRANDGTMHTIDDDMRRMAREFAHNFSLHRAQPMPR